jgi:uncharacterized protein
MENVIPKSVIEEFEKDEEIIAVLLFGSYSRGEKNYRDIDICLVLDKKYSNYEMTEKRIKYASLLSSEFDISAFQQLPLYVRIKVLKDAKVVLCKNEDRLYGIAYETIKEFELFKKAYYMYLDKVLEKHGSSK